MSTLPELIIDIISLSGRKLVGRTRLQKTVYLLDACGLNSGASYYYYNFGPFSDDVANGISDGKFSDLIQEETSYRQIDGSPFSIFKTQKTPDTIRKLGSLNVEKAKQMLEKLNSTSAVVLELAATIHWLQFIERVPDWRTELQRRKGSKTGNGRADQAQSLLNEMGFVL